MRKPDTERQVMQRIDELCRGIETYLDTFRRECPFSSEQLRLHVKTINLRFRLGSVEAALESDDFTRYLWLTLRAWGLNARGARLLPLEDFKQMPITIANPIAVFFCNLSKALTDVSVDSSLAKLNLMKREMEELTADLVDGVG